MGHMGRVGRQKLKNQKGLGLMLANLSIGPQTAPALGCAINRAVNCAKRLRAKSSRSYSPSLDWTVSSTIAGRTPRRGQRSSRVVCSPIAVRCTKIGRACMRTLTWIYWLTRWNKRLSYVSIVDYLQGTIVRDNTLSSDRRFCHSGILVFRIRPCLPPVFRCFSSIST